MTEGIDMQKDNSSVKDNMHSQLLFQQKELAQRCLDIAGVILVALDGEQKVAMINRKGCELFGHREDEIIGKNWFDEFLPDEDRERTRTGFKKYIGADIESMAKFENFIRTKSGENRLIAWSNTLLKDENGRIIGTLSSGEDITERKKAEEALRTSEATMRSILQAAPIGIGIIKNRTFYFVNDYACQVSGYAKEELLGQSARMIYETEEEFQRVGEEVYRHIAEKGVGIIETRFKTKNGDLIDVYLSAAPLDPSDSEQGFTFTAMDITRQKQNIEYLKKSEVQLRSLAAHLQTIREDERGAIAREIHDELAQVLTALKMDLSLIEMDIKERDEIFSLAKLSKDIVMMQSLIDATIKKLRRLITELRPEALDNLGLVPAIEWQIKDFQSRSGVRCDFQMNRKELSLDKNREIAIFRIIQEALTNIGRHARAKTVKVTIDQKLRHIVIRIIDDGVGFSMDILDNPKSFGLLGMKERAIVFGGSCIIESNKAAGTTVTVTLPTGE